MNKVQTAEDRYLEARALVLRGKALPSDYDPAVNVIIDGAPQLLQLRDPRAVDAVLAGDLAP